MPRSKKEERIGMGFENKWGEKYIITENYIDANHIEIEFENGYKMMATWQQIKNKQCQTPYSKVVYGVGYIGEGKYTWENDLHVYYHWQNMLMRCYDKKYQEKKPTYKGCKVKEEWHNFQVFAEWYYKNYYMVNDEEMHLDKDILFKNNKIYSSETCIFVPKRINGLFTNKKLHRGDTPVGVTKMNDGREKCYQSSCCDGYGSRKKEYFYKEYNAFLWYKLNKELVIQSIADEYKDLIPQELYEALYRYEVEITD